MIKFSLIAIFGLFVAVVSTLPLDEDGRFECDMKLTEEQSEILFSPARNGLISTEFRWPDKTLAYTLPENLSNKQKTQIELALRTMESLSCVKFVERTEQTDYVEVKLFPTSGGGCSSYVGRIRGNQTLYLSNDEVGTGCFRLGAIMHEFLHALGFYHMQSAYDRDDYVTIHCENIMKGAEFNFEKFTNKQVSHFNTTYDYYSIMHYEAYAFSKNSEPTIVPFDESKLKVIGQLERMSDKDIYKLNKMYECEHYTEA